MMVHEKDLCALLSWSWFCSSLNDSDSLCYVQKTLGGGKSEESDFNFKFSLFLLSKVENFSLLCTQVSVPPILFSPTWPPSSTFNHWEGRETHLDKTWFVWWDFWDRFIRGFLLLFIEVLKRVQTSIAFLFGIFKLWLYFSCTYGRYVYNFCN